MGRRRGLSVANVGEGGGQGVERHTSLCISSQVLDCQCKSQKVPRSPLWEEGYQCPDGQEASYPHLSPPPGLAQEAGHNPTNYFKQEIDDDLLSQ